jgi:hypothetical protein
MQKITLKFFKKESMKPVTISAENICKFEPSGKWEKSSWVHWHNNMQHTFVMALLIIQTLQNGLVL